MGPPDADPGRVTSFQAHIPDHFAQMTLDSYGATSSSLVVV